MNWMILCFRIHCCNDLFMSGSLPNFDANEIYCCYKIWFYIINISVKTFTHLTKGKKVCIEAKRWSSTAVQANEKFDGLFSLRKTVKIFFTWFCAVEQCCVLWSLLLVEWCCWLGKGKKKVWLAFGLATDGWSFFDCLLACLKLVFLFLVLLVGLLWLVFGEWRKKKKIFFFLQRGRGPSMETCVPTVLSSRNWVLSLCGLRFPSAKLP